MSTHTPGSYTAQRQYCIRYRSAAGQDSEVAFSMKLISKSRESATKVILL